jgi:hypothetical protein
MRNQQKVTYSVSDRNVRLFTLPPRDYKKNASELVSVTCPVDIYHSSFPLWATDNNCPSKDDRRDEKKNTSTDNNCPSKDDRRDEKKKYFKKFADEIYIISN